jgi:hypothetical protein
MSYRYLYLRIDEIEKYKIEIAKILESTLIGLPRIAISG